MKKSLVIICVIILSWAFIPIAIDHYKMGQWKKESLEYTDQFIELLAKEKYDELRTLYNISGDKLEDFKIKFGKISDYKYGFTNSSKSGVSGQFTGYFMHYIIQFHSEESYQGTFSISIDNNGNKPIPGEINCFTVRGRDQSREKIFHIYMKENRS